MSLILDALRKSEAERRRGEAPGLFTALPTPGLRPSRQTSPWPWLVAAAVLALAALAWWLWPSAAHAPPAPPAAPAKTVAPATAVVAAPVVAAPVVVEKAVRESRDAAPHEVVVPAPAPLPPPSPEPPAEPPLEYVPTLATLAPSERAALPPLKLSMHVWSEAPNARLAIIDGQRVMEGATVGESIVAEIRRDGVVLEWHGRRFLLPRP